MEGIRTVSVAFLLLFLFSCSDYQAVNEANPIYQRAEKERRTGEYDKAISSYEECLWLSPGSYKAHLQLAMIYEDHKNDYAQSISHYKLYLKSPNAESTSEVKKLLKRIERKYYLELKVKCDTIEKGVSVEISQVGKPQVTLQKNTEMSLMGTNKITYEPLTVPVHQVTEDNLSQARTYQVRAGDNLSGISKKVYGVSRHWEKIYHANRETLPAPHRLKPGQVLIIPKL
ncbi:MAG: LysM peptidoglycan-binding domain-containing protein [Lentisphaeria bacterium]|nr:LysM peptidoglycan-binding domain-containing protein [Lentisphaeria bacterium]NQZ67063.1 LysM peptidoglycan-binding domain-containing protein [Lentisphaeria bacterium]